MQVLAVYAVLVSQLLRKLEVVSVVDVVLEVASCLSKMKLSVVEVAVVVVSYSHREFVVAADVDEVLVVMENVGVEVLVVVVK